MMAHFKEEPSNTVTGAFLLFISRIFYSIGKGHKIAKI